MKRISDINESMSEKKERSENDSDLEYKTENDGDSETEENISGNFQDNIHILKNQMNGIYEKLYKEINKLKKYNARLNNKINDLKKQNSRQNKTIALLKYKTRRQDEKITKFEIESGIKEGKIIRLEINNERQQEKIISQGNKIRDLEDKVKSLSIYVFKAKLRKLLKKLLEYIVKNYFHFIRFNKHENKIYFKFAPYISGLTEYEIITALNSMLKVIFHNITLNNYIIHFVDEQAFFNESAKKDIEVFSKSENFFEYFHISMLHEKIIKELIPEHYFTTINNYEFDFNIEKLLNNYGLCK
jgi:hypothetical protein